MGKTRKKHVNRRIKEVEDFVLLPFFNGDKKQKSAINVKDVKGFV